MRLVAIEDKLIIKLEKPERKGVLDTGALKVVQSEGVVLDSKIAQFPNGTRIKYKSHSGSKFIFEDAEYMCFSKSDILAIIVDE